MSCVAEMYELVEAHKQYVEKYVKQMRLLFKPWPPPQADRKEPAGAQENNGKNGGAEETTNSSQHAFTTEEQEGMALADKLLQKAQKARDVQKKLEDSKKARVKRDTKATVEDTSKVAESTRTSQGVISDTKACKDLKPHTERPENVLKKGVKLQNSCDKSKINQKQSIADKKLESRGKVSSQTLKQSDRGLKRPSSSNNRKNVQSTAPFQTDARNASAKLQTTYRATIAKTGAKLQAGSAKSGKRSAPVGAVVSASSASHPQQGSVQNKLFKDTTVDDKGQTEGVKCQDIPNEHCGSSKAEHNCDKPDCDKGHTAIEHRVASLDLNNSAKGDIPEAELEESGAEHCAMFQLVKDGSSITMPSGYRKALHANRKLQQKLYAQHVTQKVNTPQKSQQFLDSFNNSFPEADAVLIHAQGRLVKQLAKVYEHLNSLLQSLTLGFINEASSPSMVLRARKLLEYILTKFHETEQLLHMSDLSLLSAVQTKESSLHHKVPKQRDSSLSVWYPNNCSFLGSDSKAMYRYRSYKQLERYMMLVYTAQWLQLQLDLMDNTAKLILPLLHSLDPTSSEFLQVLRCGYSLLSTNPCSAPVVVKDAEQDATVAEAEYDAS